MNAICSSVGSGVLASLISSGVSGRGPSSQVTPPQVIFVTPLAEQISRNFSSCLRFSMFKACANLLLAAASHALFHDPANHIVALFFRLRVFDRRPDGL